MTMPAGSEPAPIPLTCSGSTTAVSVVVCGRLPAIVTSWPGCFVHATTIGTIVGELPYIDPESNDRMVVFSNASRSASADCEGSGAPLEKKLFG